MTTIAQLNADLCGLLGLTDIGTISAVHVHMTASAPPRVEVTRRLVTIEHRARTQWRTNSFDLVPHEGAAHD